MEPLKKYRSRIFLQTGLLLAGVLSILFGIYREEVSTVLTKAIYICLECIGIG